MTPGGIAKLVKSLRRNCTHVTCGCGYHRAADAIEQLSSPVPPGEVADSIANLSVEHPSRGSLTYAARLLQRLAGELAEAKANERRNDMGLWAATNALNAAEGIRVDLERKLAARDAELAECKAQNRAMAETMSGLAKGAP
jgi:hypothetical protein